MNAVSEIRLLLEPLDQFCQADSAGKPWEYLPVPTGQASYLCGSEGEIRHLVEGHSATAAPTIVLEPFRKDQQTLLAMFSPPNTEVRVNGLVAPTFAVLRLRDVVEIGGTGRFHVSLFRRPYFGPPLVEQFGQECPVCTTSIEQKHLRIYICPGCQVALHAEPESAADQDRLQCFTLGKNCPGCGESIDIQEAYAYEPEV